MQDLFPLLVTLDLGDDFRNFYYRLGSSAARLLISAFVGGITAVAVGTTTQKARRITVPLTAIGGFWFAWIIVTATYVRDGRRLFRFTPQPDEVLSNLASSVLYGLLVIAAIIATGAMYNASATNNEKGGKKTKVPTRILAAAGILFGSLFVIQPVYLVLNYIGTTFVAPFMRSQGWI